MERNFSGMDFSEEELVKLNNLLDKEEADLTDQYGDHAGFYYSDDVFNADENIIDVALTWGVTGAFDLSEDCQIDRTTMKWKD